jgi:hypothetical protein
MQISIEEATTITQAFTKSNSFITRQLLKLLATSAEELEFPFPYENLVMSPTTYKNKFLIYMKNDSSKRGELQVEKLVKETFKQVESDYPIFM